MSLSWDEAHEPVLRKDVDQLLREHERKLAKRLRESQMTICDGQWSRYAPLTANDLADLLEADD